MRELVENSKGRSGILSVVIPAYNEATNIGIISEKIKLLLKKYKIKYEIIFIDDGSSDGTWDKIRLENEKDRRVIGARFSRNFGKEAAIVAGLSLANGQCAVVLDSDGQHPPEKIVEMYRKWQDGFDVVEGIKSSRGKEGALYKVGAKSFYKIMGHVLGSEVPNASDFKLLDQKAVAIIIRMKERLFFRAISSWVGFRTTTVEYDVRSRENGSSKWSTKKLIGYAITNIASLTTLPMQIITLLGFITILIAIALVIIAARDYFTGNALGGFTTVIIATCFMGGSIMISLGIIGYYMSKIYDEVRERPKFIIQDTISNEKEANKKQ